MPRTPRPRRTRDLERSRREILDVAFVEIQRHGFQGVSVDDIVRRTSMTKGAFYHHFPTKLALGYALVDEVITPLTLERWVAPLAGYENPLDGILHQMECLIGGAAPSALRTGCPLNNLTQEMAPIDRGFRLRLRRALARWVDELDVHLTRGQRAGFIRADVDTRQAAHFIVMLHEGVFGLIKGLGDPSVFPLLFASVKDYVRSIARG